MRRCRRFPINGLDGLEPRLVLSAGPRHARAQVMVRGEPEVATEPQARHAQAIITQAFDRFRANYFTTLNVYLTPPNNTSMGQIQFGNATVQLVNVLAQDLIRGFLPVTGSTSRQPHEQPPIQTLINNRILASTPGSLNGGLKSAIPPPNTTVNTDQLYVLTAQGAIDAAEEAVLNGIRILRLGAFNGQNGHH